mmetsp:Transcript_24561/g.55023  ORF Transcript_24561/g.55023 Transcript_24561/m.55023 type:complete len:174 (-) Transcript_24561:432-953(-)
MKTPLLLILTSVPSCMGFAPRQALQVTATTPSSMIPSHLQLAPIDVSDLVSIDSHVASIGAMQEVVSSSMMISETEAWVQPLSAVLGPFLNFFSFAMLCRIVLSWYPTANANEVPFNLIVWPTEPLLRLVRGSIPPAFGVDITPVVWLGLFSFMNEIFLGQQGLLTMKMKYGI